MSDWIVPIAFVLGIAYGWRLGYRTGLRHAAEQGRESFARERFRRAMQGH